MTFQMLDAYDFAGFRTVVDMGGGDGLVLAAILKLNRVVATTAGVSIVEGARSG